MFSVIYWYSDICPVHFQNNSNNSGKKEAEYMRSNYLKYMKVMKVSIYSKCAYISFIGFRLYPEEHQEPYVG